MVEVVGVDVEENRYGGSVSDEGAVALVGFQNEVIARSFPEVPVESGNESAYHGAGIHAAFRHKEGDERTDGRLAVHSRDRYSFVASGDLGQQFRAVQHRKT